MRRSLTLTLAALALLTVGTVGAGGATATTVARTAAKPTGTIFFSRSNAKSVLHNLSIKPSGHGVRKLPGDGTPIYPASGARITVTTVDPGPTKAHTITVAKYSGKVLHRYHPGTDFIQVLAVSPNGKDIAAEFFDGRKLAYDIATIKGKILATLVSLGPKKQGDQIEAAWNATSRQVAVVDLTEAGTSTITVYSHKGKPLRTLVKNAGPATAIAWSPDGVIAYAAAHTIHTVADNGGATQVLLHSSADFPGIGLSYSPDGADLVFGYQSGSTGITQLWLATASGSNAHEINANGFGPAWG